LKMLMLAFMIKIAHNQRLERAGRLRHADLQAVLRGAES